MTEHLSLDAFIYSQMKVIEDLTGVSSLLIFRSLGWREPFAPTDHWKFDEGASREENWNHNFHFPNFEAAKSILVDLQERGADPLYVACVVIWHVDDSKKYEFFEATEEKLKKQSSNLPSATVLNRIKNQDLPVLERTFGKTELEPLAQEVDELLGSERLTILHSTYSEPKLAIRPKRGRPSEYFWNLMMLLISRHIASSFDLPRNAKPAKGYGVIARLMKACFPGVFQLSFNYETVRNRVLNWQKNPEAIRACEEFEDRIQDTINLLRENPEEIQRRRAQADRDLWKKLRKKRNP